MNVRLRFSTTRSFIPSALIRWRTQCAQSHVEFIRDDGFTLGARWSLRKEDNGVRLRSPISIVEQINVIEYTFPEIEKAWTEGLKLVGTPYNLRGIFGIVAAKDWTQTGHMDCSNFAFEASRRAGRELLNPQEIAPWKITPRDLQLSEALTLLSHRL
jgi:hypothetical protein